MKKRLQHLVDVGSSTRPYKPRFLLVTFEVLYLLASLLFDLKLAATNWREVKILVSGLTIQKL